MRFFNTFFFGYLELKWRRLARFLSFFVLFLSILFLTSLGERDFFDALPFVILFYVIIVFGVSWLVESFVVSPIQKIKHKKHKPIKIKLNESKDRVENKKDGFENEQQVEGIWSSLLPKVDEQRDSKYFNNLKFIKWLKSLPISILLKPLIVMVEKIYLERDVIVKWIFIILALVLGNFMLYVTGIKN